MWDFICWPPAEEDVYTLNPGDELSITVPPSPRCSQGHTQEWWAAYLSVGGQGFCMKCIEERLPALLDWLGIGRILPLEEDNGQPRT